MPVDGISLVGFMEREAASTYLRERCFVGSPENAVLSQIWSDARARLREPHPRAGHPEVVALPTSLKEYVAEVRASAGFQELAETFEDIEFADVEIGPLLAYQPHIEAPRALDLCGDNADDVTSEVSLARICLPTNAETFSPQVARSDGSVIIHSESLNLRIVRSGLFEVDSGATDVVAGVYLGMGCPLLHVARFEDRYFLRNGFHRVYGLQKLGVTHIPCLVVPVRHFEDTGAVGRGMTFERETLLGDFAPTCSHYADDRALPIRLRRTTRIITATWAESLIVER